MDQNAIFNFKKLHTKAMFQRYFQLASVTELSLTELRKFFSIINCISFKVNTWWGVTYRKMYVTWKKLWPGIKHKREVFMIIKSIFFNNVLLQLDRDPVFFLLKAAVSKKTSFRRVEPSFINSTHFVQSIVVFVKSISLEDFSGKNFHSDSNKISIIRI